MQEAAAGSWHSDWHDPPAGDPKSLRSSVLRDRRTIRTIWKAATLSTVWIVPWQKSLLIGSRSRLVVDIRYLKILP